MEVTIEESDHDWAVIINHYKGDPEDRWCVGASDKGDGGTRLSAIEDALLNLQSGIVTLDEMRNQEHAGHEARRYD